MVNEEIFGGLKLAVEKGESLKNAMMTFYNAGYEKQQIEEAAKSLAQIPTESNNQSSQTPSNLLPPKAPTQQVKSQLDSIPTTIENNKQVKQIVSSYGEPTAQPKEQIIPKTIQNVSNYSKDKNKGKGVIIFLILLLILLFGILVFIFLFRKEIINFFGTTFS